MNLHRCREILDFVLPSCALAVTVLSPCVSVYCVNRDQFALDAWTMAAIILIPFLLLTAAVTLLLALCRNTRAYAWIYAGTVALSVALFAQYYFYNDLFPIEICSDGFTPDFILLLTLHIISLTVPFGLAFYLRRGLLRYSGKISAVILLTQISIVVLPLFNRPEVSNYDFRSYTFSEQNKFSFAARDNIIVLVVDAMGERIGKEVLEKFPEMSSLLKDFTGFDRMVSPLPHTMYAVPAMLTGQNFPRTADSEPDPDSDHADYLKTACHSPASLFQALKKDGFRIEGYPFILQTISYAPDVIDNSIPLNFQAQKQSALKILDTVLARQVPAFLKPLIEDYYFIATDPFVTPMEQPASSPQDAFDQVFYRRLSGEFRIGNFERGFKYLHLHGAHDPVRTDEKLELNTETLKYKQLRGSLKNLELLLSRLRTAGLYDRATIVVIGDHTENYTPESIAFIKRRDEHHESLAFNSVPCQLSDIAPAILGEYGLADASGTLFHLPPKAGDLHLVRENQSEHRIQLSPWQAISRSTQTPTINVIYPDSFILENNRIIMAFPQETTGTWRGFSLLAESIDRQHIFDCDASTSKTISGLGSTSLNFPDGIYRVFLRAKGQNDTPKAGKIIQVLPKFLIMNNGRGVFSAGQPDVPACAMTSGETISFRPMQIFPQLLIPLSSRIPGNVLTLDFDAVLGIRIPAQMKKAHLEVSLQYPATTPGTLVVFADDHEVYRVHVKDFCTVSCPVELPESTSSDGIRTTFLRFEFQPMLRNRSRLPPGRSLRLNSVTLR